MKKIKIIGTYFGNWPPYFPAFLRTCEANTTINWVFFTDCPIPSSYANNIEFVKTSLKELNERASNSFQTKINKGVYAQLDLRPGYGHLFKEYLEGYDFWGHCDFDVIWGDLRAFFTDNLLDNYDVISSRVNILSGHCTLWNNSDKINSIYKLPPNYLDGFSNNEHVNFDEQFMSRFLKKQDIIKVYWHWGKKIVGGYPELKLKPVGWYWQNGKIFDKDNSEHAYMHLIYWKHQVKRIDFKLSDNPNKFQIRRSGIWAKKVPFLHHFLDKFSLDEKIKARLKYHFKVSIR